MTPQTCPPPEIIIHENDGDVDDVEETFIDANDHDDYEKNCNDHSLQEGVSRFKNARGEKRDCNQPYQNI